ncbi:hypothetical protein [Methylocucumis oryzae]|uniref:Uncharacterized protein n=1 Tax=Methylocucumis oryzae TaxID=1632867 RepID=A0A0F3IHR8_9GAMM|nr:hypothetical protein [Methylocucumis oryzae]KJV05009.1 hypothetical protein VZ94_21250 [Methylocucumis oryzae]
MNVNTLYQANVNGFVLVRLAATPEQRRVAAEGMVDGEIVASGSAADNTLESVISSPKQTFTFRVLKGSKWEVDSDEITGVEVRWVK